MSESQQLFALARRLVDRADGKGMLIALAESCTGGMVASAITAVPGASAVFERGFVTYSNEAKAEMLGVPPRLIEQCGAVSEAVARSMAEGALSRSHADIALSVTGIAGPGGGTSEKPVGLVWFALAAQTAGTRIERRVFPAGDRGFVRLKAAETALRLLLHGL